MKKMLLLITVITLTLHSITQTKPAVSVTRPTVADADKTKPKLQDYTQGLKLGTPAYKEAMKKYRQAHTNWKKKRQHKGRTSAKGTTIQPHTVPMKKLTKPVQQQAVATQAAQPNNRPASDINGAMKGRNQTNQPMQKDNKNSSGRLGTNPNTYTPKNLPQPVPLAPVTSGSVNK